MKNKKGFTLVEIIVVLVILGILLAIAIPNVINYIDKANDKSNELAARNVFLAAQIEAAELYGKGAEVNVAAVKPAAAVTAGVAADGITSITFKADHSVNTITYNGWEYGASGMATNTNP